jgi:hypothetical protein
MKMIRNTLLVGTALFLMVLGDAPKDAPFGLQLMPEAHAIFGVWRRRAIIGSAVVASTAAAASETYAVDQQSAPSGSLPLGTVVYRLPGGCTDTPVGGVDHHYCGGTFYRAVFQGNQLVYVTAQP